MQEEILTKLENSIETELTIGKPRKTAGITLVPLLNVLVGGGIKDETAGGGGVALQPKAVIIIDDQEVSYFSLADDIDEGEIKRKLPKVIEKIESVN